MRAEGRGALGGRPKGDPRLSRERVGLGTLGRVRVGRQVVAGQRAGELVGAERLEEARRGEVPGLPVRAGQRVVGHLADEGLDEGVLAAFRRSGIALLGEQLASDQRAQALLQLGGIDARHRGEAGQGERLAEGSGIGDEQPVGRVEPVEPACDQGGERLRHGQRGQVAERPVDPLFERETALGEEHPDRLYGVQRDAVGALDMARMAPSGSPGTRPPRSSRIAGPESGSR